MGNIITRTDAEALIPVESSKEIIQAVQHESAVLQLISLMILHYLMHNQR